eukprot:TRINITY_DN14318_c0_g1_i1.p4 TRINITY_DN14318_c0_g1~~TRINITY_DN14318_c0_g1_i1.p4  ORF type:complete len:105 (+),score=27.23 TRINITY_DN14318_c0_g1_i1:157-471(+)
MQRGLVGSEMCIRDRYILSALEKNTSLKNLNLAHNYLGATRWNYSLLKNPRLESLDPVSYTHLTLPTILLVQISVVAASLKKKTHDTQDVIDAKDIVSDTCNTK